eukprot:105549_1
MSAGHRVAGDDTGDSAKDTLFQQDGQQKCERKGCCAPCQWFKEKPLSRWQFGVFLLFGFLTLIWLIMKATGGITGEVLAGLCALILSCYAANHFRLLLGLKEQVDRFSKNNRRMKSENSAIRTEVSKLSKAQQELSAVHGRLEETNRAYQSNIEKFKNLDERLSKLAADNISGLEKLQEMSKTVQDSITKELVQHERDIVFRVQESMEIGDDQDGLSEDEFNRFIAALPLSFRQRFENMAESWSDIAGDDGVLDMEEFTALADKFALEEAAAGGSC